MTYDIVGLGVVAAADSAIADMDATRFMPPNSKSRWAAGYFTIVTATSVKIRPVYVREVDVASGQSWDDMPRYEDPGQEVEYTVAGSYTAEFRARPGCRIGFRVQTFAGGGSVSISGQYQPPDHG